MARYVWEVTYRWEGGPDGGESLGLFTSRTKAKSKVREHAELPKGSRRLRWEDDGYRKNGTFLWTELTTQDGVNVYGEPIMNNVHYYVSRRAVR